ncbi:hypothetical protein GCM10010405_49640 [Streptomyces macrosporus]|uniref:Uncharacterized protein n=2 Tax=Streptomyces macrosporus TaxID=44032 RepID=A0ABP5XP86_9ACTN
MLATVAWSIGRGGDGDGAEAAFRLGAERCGKAAAGRDLGVPDGGIGRGGHGP